jgi:MoaA/NifB/PqqE/SkfB family radical SAM enzyme
MELRGVLEKLRGLFESPKRRFFGSIQVEATSECFLRCTMCPRSAYIKKWYSGAMPFSTFKKISKYFPLAGHVHLQGWGEPLLHDRIYDMMKIAKEAGCSVGFTTNGMLLVERACRKIVDIGVDIIGISIAGATSKVHKSVRVNSCFSRLIGNINTLGRIKRETGSQKPKVVLSFLMTSTNIHELPKAVELAREHEVDEFVATNLDYPSTKTHETLKVFSCGEINQRYAALIEKSKGLSKSMGLSFRAYPLQTEEVIMCELNPVSYVYISHDGLVAPCVYLNQTRSGRFPRLFCGSRSMVKRTTFGDINKEDLLDIWMKPEYRAFRYAYIRRQEAYYDAFGDIPIDFGFSKKIRGAEKRALKALNRNPVPDACRTCYKAYGI